MIQKIVKIEAICALLCGIASCLSGGTTSGPFGTQPGWISGPQGKCVGSVSAVRFVNSTFHLTIKVI